MLAHPFVIGELACGNLVRRGEILEHLGRLPRAALATEEEVLWLIAEKRLWGAGIGWIDAHLLASTLLSRTSLWTADRRLAEAATRLGVSHR